MIHTHYDNLKVARNAPPEVVRAAYKSLSMKFHPDRNPENSEATRIMAIINASYEVLSDTEKRQQHDMWIAQQEAVAEQTAHSNKQQ
jgi:DnaJ-class molecular chaperone